MMNKLDVNKKEKNVSSCLKRKDNAASKKNKKKKEFVKNKKLAAIITGASLSEQHTTEDITEGVKGPFDAFTIGVFHCNVDAADQDDVYAPCKLSSLIEKKVDYWALGHIHKRSILHENPYVVYPGNTQGRNHKESDEKGAYLVTVKDDIVTDMEFFRTGPIVWRDIELDITDKTDISEVISQIGDTEEGSMLRISVVGTGPLDSMARLAPEGLSELIESRTGCKVTRIDIQSRPVIDLAARKETGDFVSAVINYGDRLETSTREELLEMICCTTTARSLMSRFENFTDDELREIVRDATYMIVERMTEAGE